MSESICKKLIIVLLFSGLISLSCSTEKEKSSDLETLWTGFKENYIMDDGRVVDRRLNRVTSESQSYGLLRAVLMSDRACFEKVLKWTQNNLQREDKLYSWLWSPVDNGSLKDINCATDADTDIAFALIIAAYKFNNRKYLESAGQIVRSIRLNTAIKQDNGSWFPSAGNWAINARIINLSYFSPAAYLYFDIMDPEGNWQKTVEEGFRILKHIEQTEELIFIPDFCILKSDGSTGELPPESKLSRLFSYDSIRIYWRVALYNSFNTPLFNHNSLTLKRLAELYNLNRKIFSKYTIRGKRLSRTVSPSFYGALLPALSRSYPETADTVLNNDLTPSLIRKLKSSTHRYYDSNWVWFGLSLHSGHLMKQLPSLNEFKAFVNRLNN